jgi:REP element-mobilizing transposase RayT
MPQSLANVWIHAVFSTKNRRPFLKPAELRDRMHRYLAGISAKLECPAKIVGGTDDHVHILACQSRTVSIADWVKEIKRASSLWAKTECDEWQSFQWQLGYGVFSVSQSLSHRAYEYIAAQEEHHRKLSFQDEMRKILQRHGIAFDEQYVWD